MYFRRSCHISQFKQFWRKRLKLVCIAALPPSQDPAWGSGWSRRVKAEGQIWTWQRSTVLLAKWLVSGSTCTCNRVDDEIVSLVAFGSVWNVIFHALLYFQQYNLLYEEVQYQGPTTAHVFESDSIIKTFSKPHTKDTSVSWVWMCLCLNNCKAKKKKKRCPPRQLPLCVSKA